MKYLFLYISLCICSVAFMLSCCHFRSEIFSFFWSISFMQWSGEMRNKKKLAPTSQETQ